MIPENKELPRVYIEYKSWSNGGDVLDPSDRWSNRSKRVTEVKFIKLYREPPIARFFYDSVLSDPRMLKMDKLFLAVVRYSTGDTFGHSSGEWYIVGVAPTRKIAKLMLAEETKAAVNGDYANYKRWQGYFESLEGTEIHELDLV